MFVHNKEPTLHELSNRYHTRSCIYPCISSPISHARRYPTLSCNSCTVLMLVTSMQILSMKLTSSAGTSLFVSCPTGKASNRPLFMTSVSLNLPQYSRNRASHTRWNSTHHIDQAVILIHYQIYSPFQRNWLNKLNTNLAFLDASPAPAANDVTIRTNVNLRHLFESEVPDHVEGFECSDRVTMGTLFPEGTEKARQVESLKPRPPSCN